jgi:hypothetical protein
VDWWCEYGWIALASGIVVVTLVAAGMIWSFGLYVAGMQRASCVTMASYVQLYAGSPLLPTLLALTGTADSESGPVPAQMESVPSHLASAGVIKPPSPVPSSSPLSSKSFP